MSFPKARIQRFNELENDVPAPGAYDPKFDSKIKGTVLIEKSERFHDDKSVASAEGSLSVCNRSTHGKAHNVDITFRTPQLTRKKIRNEALRSKPKTKPRSLIPVQDQQLKYKLQHQLVDLQVECSNKDKTIQEQEKHIDDTKEEVQKLQLQLEELSKKQIQMEEQHKKDMEAMAKLQQEILNGRDEKYQDEVENLRRKLLETSEEKEREIQTRKEMEGDLKDRIAAFSKKISLLGSELANKKCAGEEKIQTLGDEITELTTKMEKLMEDHKHEINLLAKEKSELNSRIDDLSDERDKLKLKLQKRQNVILELQTQLSALECELDELKAEYEKLIDNSEKQVDDLRYKHHEEIDKLKVTFENEKTVMINEYKFEAAQRLEIETKAKENDELNNFLKQELDNVQSLYKDVSNRLKEAHQELEESDKKYTLAVKKHTKDLVDIKKQLEEEKYKLSHELEHAKKDYLKEIENLTAAKDMEIAELQELTTKKIEEETKRVKQHADKMIENAEMVTKETLAAGRAECNERVKKIIAENDAKANAMIKEAKAAVEEEIRITAERHKACLERVETERAALDEKLLQKDTEITRLTITLEQLRSEKTTENTEIQKQFHEVANDLKEARSVLLQFEESNDAQQIEISRLELLNTKLSEQLKEREEIVNEATSKIKDLCDKMKNLEDRNKHLEDEVELFKRDHQDFETTFNKELAEEKLRREILEAENKNLVEINERLEKNYALLNDKYAELVGHNNHRQRIKHLSQLKDKISQLEQELNNKMRIIQDQQKTIDKLKGEDKRAHITGKENMHNISKSATSTSHSSPHKPLTPLKSRND